MFVLYPNRCHTRDVHHKKELGRKDYRPSRLIKTGILDLGSKDGPQRVYEPPSLLQMFVPFFGQIIQTAYQIIKGDCNP